MGEEEEEEEEEWDQSRTEEDPFPLFSAL